MSIPPIPYIPGSGEDHQLPLQRFLPPLSKGVVQEWLEQNVKKGSWVLDPFGTNPAVALEAARAGYKVLVACQSHLGIHPSIPRGSQAGGSVPIGHCRACFEQKRG